MADIEDDIDFGEICDEGCYVPQECCNRGDQEIPNTDIINNYTVIAHKDGLNKCGRYREFLVNLHRDGSWSFTFKNGEPLNQDQIQNYCQEISGAQEMLSSYRQWILRGRGLGIWDYTSRNRAGGDGAIQDNDTIYYPSGILNSNTGSCSIKGQANLNVRPI